MIEFLKKLEHFEANPTVEFGVDLVKLACDFMSFEEILILSRIISMRLEITSLQRRIEHE